LGASRVDVEPLGSRRARRLRGFPGWLNRYILDERRFLRRLAAFGVAARWGDGLQLK
jgi:hypothetical protein